MLFTQVSVHTIFSIPFPSSMGHKGFSLSVIVTTVVTEMNGTIKMFRTSDIWNPFGCWFLTIECKPLEWIVL